MRAGLALALGLAGLATLLLAPGRLLPPDPPVAFSREEVFDHGVVSPRGRVAAEGVSAGPKGFTLPPGERGWVEYRTAWEQPAPPWVWLQVSALLGEEWRAGRLSLETPPEGFQPLAENRTLLLGRFEVGERLRGGRQAAVRVEGENPTPAPQILLRKLSLVGYAEQPEPAVPLAAAVLAAALLATGACLATPRWRRHLPLAALLVLAFAPRYANYLRALHAGLDPDAIGFRRLAEQFDLASLAGINSAALKLREPLFPLLVKGALALLGQSDSALRFVSLVGSLAATGLTWRLGRGLLGARWGWLPAAAAAVSLPLVVESGRGLRLELELVLLLLFADLAFLKGRWRPLPRGLAVGAVAGLLVLTRASHAPGLGLLILLAGRGWFASRRLLLPPVAALLLMGLLYSPHAAALYRAHGHPFQDQRIHARWFANQEFAGQPGFPSREAVARDGYLGGPLGFGSYLFGLHSVGEVAGGYLRGFGKLLSRMDLIGRPEAVRALLGLELGWLDWGVRVLGWAGLAATVGSGHGWLLAATLGLTFPVAFQYDRGLTEAHRLILHVFPFYWCGIGLLLARLAEPLARFRAGDPKEDAHA